MCSSRWWWPDAPCRLQPRQMPDSMSFLHFRVLFFYDSLFNNSLTTRLFWRFGTRSPNFSHVSRSRVKFTLICSISPSLLSLFESKKSVLQYSEIGRSIRNDRDGMSGKMGAYTGSVAVGMPVARHPTYRSVHEELPHTAPALCRSYKQKP